MLTFAATGSIAPAVLWGCLEVSIGVVSACIPSLMPLFLSLVGMKRPSADGRNRGYVKYENGNIKHSTNRTNRFRRFMTVRDLETLPEALDLYTITETGTQSEDDVRLVEGRQQPGDILVTNQILVSEAQPKPLETNTGERKPWDAKVPPTAHVR